MGKKHIKHLRGFSVTAALLAAVALMLLIFPELQRLSDRTAYPVKWRETVLDEAKRYGVPPSLCFAVILCESGFREGAVSTAGAKGLMQLTDDTFEWVSSKSGVTGDIFDPETNIRCGIWLLMKNSEDFSGFTEVLAAYNAGRACVSDWLKNPELSSDGEHLDKIPYSETERYVAKVLAAAKEYQRIYSYD